MYKNSATSAACDEEGHAAVLCTHCQLACWHSSPIARSKQELFLKTVRMLCQSAEQDATAVDKQQILLVEC